MGLSLSYSYFVARERAAAQTLADRIRRLAQLQVSLLTVLHVVVLAAVVQGKPEYIAIAAAITVLSVPLSFASEYSLAALQGLGDLQRTNLLRVLTPIAYALGLLPLAAIGDADLTTIVVVMMATNAIATVPAVIAARRRVGGREGNSATQVREIRRFALGSFAGYFSPLEAFRLDQLMVGLYVSPRALGIYVAGSAVANVPRFFGSAVGLIVAPALSAERDVAVQLRQLKRFTALTTALTLLIALPLIASIGLLLPLLFGDAFREGIAVGRWLLIASVFLAVRRVIANAARGLGHPAISAPSELLSTAVFVGGMLALGGDASLASIGALFTAANGLGLALLAVRMRQLLNGLGEP
jgi:O-antigen/teichoic acid export membrane protein